MKRLLLALPALLLPALLLPAAADLPIQPGKWQSVVTILDMQSPNMPPGVGAAMRAHPTTVTACVTAAQAADGPRSVIANSHGKCHFTSFSTAGGRINSVMQCAFATGTMTVTSTGSYTPTMMDVTGSSVTTGRMIMRSKTHSVSRRVGAC